MNMKILNDYIELNDNICFSGGADGADKLFGEFAEILGHNQIHFSFKNHKSKVPAEYVLELSDDVLKSTEIKNKLYKANESLGRSVPNFGYVYKLLARNSYQVLYTERLYTIGSLSSPSQLDGGTAWAVQMYLDMNLSNHEIYHFNINDNKVYSFDDNIWEFVEVNEVPTPYGKWTGIGSRKATYYDFENFIKRFI